MRSCKYSYVGKAERETRAVRACNVNFRVGTRVIKHDHLLLHQSESVSINLGMQKWDIRDKIVSQDNNNKAKLNPVTLLARTAQYLLKYPG